MFQFSIVEKDLNIILPKSLKFDTQFHFNMTYLINYILNIKLKNNIDRFIFKSPKNIHYEKMCKAYICNVLEFFQQRGLTIYINVFFKENIIGFVHKEIGKSNYNGIDIFNSIIREDLTYYTFKGDKEIDKPVKDIVKTISNMSLMLNEDEFKDFLTTTIGEIFSNSVNHSEQDEVFFLFNVENEDKSFYLYVSIIDYGRTIISNVRKFLNDDIKAGKECMSWAIKAGNTTRIGSGGYGLDMLIRYIRAVQGNLIILSGNASYILTSKNKVQINDSQKHFFEGTSVTFKIKLFNRDILSYKNGNIDCLSLDEL